MATVTVLTAEKMMEIRDETIVNIEVVAGDLILTRYDGSTVNAGPFMAAPPAVTGSRGGNAALASLLTQLAAANIITNSTTA